MLFLYKQWLAGRSGAQCVALIVSGNCRTKLQKDLLVMTLIHSSKCMAAKTDTIPAFFSISVHITVGGVRCILADWSHLIEFSACNHVRECIRSKVWPVLSSNKVLSSEMVNIIKLAPNVAESSSVSCAYFSALCQKSALSSQLCCSQVLKPWIYDGQGWLAQYHDCQKIANFAWILFCTVYRY